jgi:Mg-chelatase subunit ChlD
VPPLRRRPHRRRRGHLRLLAAAADDGGRRAVDYTRASSARVDLQAAVDAAALTIGRVAIETGRTDNSVQARQAFDAGFQRTDGTTVVVFNVTQDAQRIVVDVDARVPLQFAGILNRNSIDVNARAEIPLDLTTVEVALVLDTTGSMNSSGKLAELKNASTLLINMLENASAVSTRALVAVVPFATQVNVGASNPRPTWVRIRNPEPDWRLWGVTATNWSGCIADRDKTYHARVDLPNGMAETQFPAVRCAYSVAQIMPLTRNFATARTNIANLVAEGNTNTTIGFAWGLNVLTRDAPLGGAAERPGQFVRKHMVFLTDGRNTANRFGDSEAQIDRGSEDLCADIRATYPEITVHTIRLIEGDEALLKKCATADRNYHYARTAAELTAVFKSIADQILTLRLGY